MSKLFKVVSNWKMNKTCTEAVKFVHTLPPLNNPTFVAAPFTAIKVLADLDIPMLQIGAQNIHSESEGPFTGEISAKMVKDAGAEFVILGHSERRSHFNESNTFINEKVKQAFIDDLEVILCIGETSIDRENGRTHEVLSDQLLQSLDGIELSHFQQLSIAYEPIWAIGTGEAATPQAAQEVHCELRKLIEEKWNLQAAERVSLLYGGSVNPDNIEELAKQPDIDGVLVGGASLKTESITQIILKAQGD